MSTPPPSLPETKARLLELRGIYVKSVMFHPDGTLQAVEFFGPDVVRAAMTSQMLDRHVASGDISGQSPKVMDLRAKLAACDDDQKRAYLEQQLQAAMREDMVFWSSD